MAGESQGGIKMRQSIDEQSISVCHMADSSKCDPNDYGFSSWIDYWANGRGVSSPVSPYCPCCELIKKVIVGGHEIAKSSGSSCILSALCNGYYSSECASLVSYPY